MSFFETVLISALTSAGVTLAIEWAAKPRLEVRKERILEEAKAKRTVEKNLETIVNLATSLDAGTSGQDTLSVILLVSANLETSLAAVALKIDPRPGKFISQAATWIQDRVRARVSDIAQYGEPGLVAKDLVTVSSFALDLYRLSWWQFLRRRYFFKEAEQLASRLARPPDLPSSQPEY